MLRRFSRPELLELELLDTEVTPRAPRRADAVLGVEALSARLGRRVVIRDVDLHVCAGEIVALVGHNGSGKTTSLRAIAGLTPPETGVIDIRGDCAVRYVPTERSVFADLSVRDNLWLGAGRVTSAVRAARVDAALTLFPELRSRTEQRAGVLSGGEQRLVALAIALMGEPRLLLVDEPTQFLGPAATRRVLEAIRRLTDEAGLAVLMAETNIAAVARIADRVYVITNGSVTSEHPGVVLRASEPRSWWRLLDQGPR
jgi:branched-chain amino acid transport system ATP-binding protein